MIAGLTDTHTALWYLSKHPSLSLTARNFIDSAAQAGNDVVISPISLAEILYLIEKNRMPLSAYEDVKAALADPASVLQEAPFNINVVDAMRQVPRDDIPDMHDRIVAATAIFLGVPVISRGGPPLFATMRAGEGGTS